MEQSIKSQADPLDGYRANLDMDAIRALEDEVMAYRGLAEDDIDTAALQAVMKKNALMNDLTGESTPLKRLVTHCYMVMEDATNRWVEVSDPKSESAVNAHHDARAARLVLDWVGDQITVGKQAEVQLEAESNE